MKRDYMAKENYSEVHEKKMKICEFLEKGQTTTQTFTALDCT